MEMNLEPLLQTLSKITAGRIVPWADVEEVGDLCMARIPVRFVEASDKTETFIRRYVKDWLKKQQERLAVDTRFLPMRGPEAVFTDDEGITFPIAGVLHIRWWPKPELSEQELREIEWFAAQQKKRERYSD